MPLSSLPLLVLAVAPVLGLDTPEFTRSWKGQRSEGLEGVRARVTCRAYATFSIVEENDPGLRGAKSIVVRDRPPTMLAARACAELFHTPSRKLERADVSVEGALGPWVVLRSADGAGGAVDLILIEAATGNVVAEVPRFASASPRFVRSKKKAALEFHTALAVACPLVDGCDRAALTNAGVPATLQVRLDLSGCRSPELEDASPRIFVPARIDDIEHPTEPVFRAGTAYCVFAE
jgi:hypothetical protein